MALEHWLQLSLTEGIGPILTRRIVAAAGSAQAACLAPASLLETVEGIGNARAARLSSALRMAAGKVEAELSRAQERNIQIFCFDDEQYPLLLRDIPDPPAVLYMRGDLQPRDLHAVAIVGSRRCSFYGREQAERFGALLAGAGLTVVSGGARGVDSSAHRGALSHPQGRTLAVLGCGLDIAYPPENGPLFDLIAQRGAVLSEFAIGTPPNKENFPRRNRIVSGLSRGVLVVEADMKSGALITARQACDDHGRPVFAIPGRVDNALSAGPHQLIRDGAVLTTGIEDVVNNLGPLPDAASAPSALSPIELSADDPNQSETRPAEEPIPPMINLRQRAILARLGRDPVGVDMLIDQSGLAAHEVLQELTFLTLMGHVRRIDGQTFARQTVKPSLEHK